MPLITGSKLAIPNQEVELESHFGYFEYKKHRKLWSCESKVGNGFPIRGKAIKDKDSSVWNTDSSLLDCDTSL